MKTKIVKKAVKATLPVMAGYLVLGAGFGIVMKANGYGIWWTVSMSLFIYAGSMQYIGVGLLTSGASLLSVALTTLMVNARHLFYGLSMVEKYKDTGAKKPYLIFSLTDETYSIVCSSEKDSNFYFLVSLLDHSYWVLGTAVGSLLGSVLRFNTEGIDFALTALFLTVFTDQWLHGKKHFSAVCGVVVSVACLLLFGPDRFLIPAMLLIAAALVSKGYLKKEVKTDG
ncbi:MAG: AzlC family ABC transporter permease [Faecousia sp.]